MAVVEDLEDRVRRLKELEAGARQKRAQFASQRAVREDRLGQVEGLLRAQYGVSGPEEERAKLVELRGELEATLRAAEQSLGEVGNGG